MFFKEVIHDTDNENLKMLAPIPIWIQYFDDHDFHDRLFDYGKAVLDAQQKRMGQELPEQIDSERIDNYSVNPPNVYGFGHKEYYHHVVDCLLNDKKHLVDGLEGRKSLELINAIYESIETGNQVNLRFKPSLCKLGRID